MFRSISRQTPYYILATMATVPVWIVRYPPVQDLPLHAATIRILSSFSDPAYGFPGHYTLALNRTQYVFYHLTGAALARIVDPMSANALLMSAYLGGTVLALRSLTRALGSDERLCLFVIPLLFNVPFLLGLLPFALGIPLMFAALATALRDFRSPTMTRGSLLALLTVALFYSHVVPFGLCGIGYVALFPWSRPKAWVRAAAPWIPVMPLAVWWTFGTDAGRITSGALFDTSGVAHKPLISSAVDFDRWVIDVFMDSSGQRVFFALMVVAIAAIALAATGQDRPAPVARSYVCLPLACLVCYLALAEGHDYVFFIAQRFPVLLLMTAIPLLPMPSGWPGRAITAAAAVLAVASVVNVSRHFQHFEREEVGAFDLAIAEMTPNSRVCALIYEPASRIMRDAPFLHFGSYYQVQKGGVVMFTYAGYAHWPIDFAPGKYPPPGRPARLRWEWTPASVPIAEVYPYYDFVLTRGHGFRPPAGTYHLVRKDENWAVWARDVPAR